MATEIIKTMLGEHRAASTADGGTALGTAAVCVPLPFGSNYVWVKPRNFAGGATVAKLTFNPWIHVLMTKDLFATAPTDLSDVAQDGSTSTDLDLSSFNTLANGDMLLVLSRVPIRGVLADIDAANGNASVLTVNYWHKGQKAWTTTGATDNTAAAGKSIAQDGTIEFTVPTDWGVASLREIADKAGYNLPKGAWEHEDMPFYALQFVWSAALDAACRLNSLYALNRSTAYSEWVSGDTLEGMIQTGPGGIGCIEALVNAGTGNLIVNVATRRDAQFR